MWGFSTQTELTVQKIQRKEEATEEEEAREEQIKRTAREKERKIVNNIRVSGIWILFSRSLVAFRCV